MKITRIATSETVPLEDGFLWSDEFDWQPIEQKVDRAIDGSAIVQEGEKKSARSMVFEPADSSMGWIKRRHLNTLREWSMLQDERFRIEFEWPHDNRRFTVIFNHENGAFKASPVKGFPTVSDDDYYNVTMRFWGLE